MLLNIVSDDIISNVQAVVPVLDNPNEPVNELSYFDCLDVVAEKAMVTHALLPSCDYCKHMSRVHYGCSSLVIAIHNVVVIIHNVVVMMCVQSPSEPLVQGSTIVTHLSTGVR